jgi:hypothetical protein
MPGFIDFPARRISAAEKLAGSKARKAAISTPA